MNYLVPFFPNAIEKRIPIMPKNCLTKCLKWICVYGIKDDIVIIINYG
jgi:hypothetical protein